MNPELLEALRPDKLVPSTDAVPERFELGTLPYELMAGTKAAVDFLADLSKTDGPRRDRLVAGYAALEQHETALRTRIEDGIAAIGGGTRCAASMTASGFDQATGGDEVDVWTP